MKSLEIVLVLVAVLGCVSAEQYCYKNSKKLCEGTLEQVPACTARYGGIKHLETPLQKYANAHIARSFEYLLMATHFGNYEKNRMGFEKLFRKLSDETWQDAIELIKYLGKRGAKHDFSQRSELLGEDESGVYEEHELQALSKAVDIQKKLANEAFDIYRGGNKNSFDHHYDADITHYIQEKFAEKQSESVRSLVGYTNDLAKLLATQDSSLAMYLFDEFLQKNA